MERVAVVYRGRVQGVGFRATVLGIAERPGAGRKVTGWVRNEADGSVRLEAQGEAEDLESLLERVERRLGRNIESARREPMAAVAGEDGFEIRY